MAKKQTESGEAKSGFMFGNKDTENEFQFKEVEKDYFVIRHSRMEKMTSGAIVEDSGSVKYQFYRQEFIRMQRILEDKNEANIFNSDEVVKILHDPTLKTKSVE